MFAFRQLVQHQRSENCEAWIKKRQIDENKLDEQIREVSPNASDVVSLFGLFDCLSFLVQISSDVLVKQKESKYEASKLPTARARNQ